MLRDLKNCNIGNQKEAQYRNALLSCCSKLYHELSGEAQTAMKEAIVAHQKALEGHDGFTKEKHGDELQLAEDIITKEKSSDKNFPDKEP